MDQGKNVCTVMSETHLKLGGVPNSLDGATTYSRSDALKVLCSNISSLAARDTEVPTKPASLARISSAAAAASDNGWASRTVDAAFNWSAAVSASDKLVADKTLQRHFLNQKTADMVHTVQE